MPDRHVDGASAIQVIAWWEKRRFGYNLVVGSAGILTCALMLACAFVSEAAVGVPLGLSDGPLLGVFAAIAYGIMANISYTGGWISELAVRSVHGQQRAAVYGAGLPLRNSILISPDVSAGGGLLDCFGCRGDDRP